GTRVLGRRHFVGWFAGDDPAGWLSEFGAKCRGVLLPWAADEDGVEQANWGWKDALHVRAVVVIEWFEKHSESDGLLGAGDLGDGVLTDGVPLLLCEGHRGERHDLLFLVVEMALRDGVQRVERGREVCPRLR